MMGAIPWIFAGLVAGGILHILYVFSVPWLAEQDAWGRLSSHAPLNTLSVVDETSAGALPFSSPDVVHAYCLFDLSERNLVVTSPLLDGPWSLAVSTRLGENFYIVTGADAKKSDTRILITPRSRLSQETSTEKSEEGDEQNIIISPTTTGIVTIRAPLRGESFRAQTVEAIKRAHCELQKPSEPLVAAAAPEHAAVPAAQSTPGNVARRPPRRPRRRSGFFN